MDPSKQQMNTSEINRKAWDDRVKRGNAFTQSATEEQFENPLAVVDPGGWLGDDVKGKRVLCLASGGGYQSTLFAATGALVTVVDLSPEMLNKDRIAADKRGYKVRTVETSMEDLSMLEEDGFDYVIQPVSTCYVQDVCCVYREVSRVIVAGGLYISQHKQPVSLQADLRPDSRGYVINESYYRNSPLPQVHGSIHRESGTQEFIHRWELLVGGLCRNGFQVEDLVEPYHGEPQAERGAFSHRSLFVAPYVRIKARRTLKEDKSQSRKSIWIP